MKKYLLALIATTMLTVPAVAQDASVFSADRPGHAADPLAVPSGVWQVESDLFNYSRQGQVNTLTMADPTVRYGLMKGVEIDLGTGGLVQQWTHVTKHKTVYHVGVGDTTVAARVNLVGENSPLQTPLGGLTAGVLVSTKIPTATHNMGNGVEEFAAVMPVSLAAPCDFTITAQPGIAELRNSLNNGRSATMSGVLNLSHPITATTAGFVEYYRSSSNDHATRTQQSADFGVTYLLTPRIQLDTSANIGLNHATAALTVGSGIAVRF